jgi:hypothetical protein
MRSIYLAVAQTAHAGSSLVVCAMSLSRSILLTLLFGSRSVFAIDSTNGEGVWQLGGWGAPLTTLNPWGYCYAYPDNISPCFPPPVGGLNPGVQVSTPSGSNTFTLGDAQGLTMFVPTMGGNIQIMQGGTVWAICNGNDLPPLNCGYPFNQPWYPFQTCFEQSSSGGGGAAGGGGAGGGSSASSSSTTSTTRSTTSPTSPAQAADNAVTAAKSASSSADSYQDDPTSSTKAKAAEDAISDALAGMSILQGSPTSD